MDAQDKGSAWPCCPCPVLGSASATLVLLSYTSSPQGCLAPLRLPHHPAWFWFRAESNLSPRFDVRVVTHLNDLLRKKGGLL